MVIPLDIVQAEKAFAVNAGGEGEEVEAGTGMGGGDPFGGGLGGLGGAMGGMPGGMPPGVTPEMYQKMMKVILVLRFFTLCLVLYEVVRECVGVGSWSCRKRFFSSVW